MQENIHNQYSNEQEIDIMELISKLWKLRSMIIKWCIAGAIVGLVVGFSIPKTYTASVTLAPENADPKSGMSSLAAMAGINLQQGVDAINAEMYPDVIHSTPFIFDLFDIPVSFEHKDTIVNTTLIDYMLEYQKSPWWTPVLKFPMKAIGWCINLVTPKEEESTGDGTLNPYNLPKEEREVVNFFSENILVNVDKKTGKTSISLDLQDPVIAYTVVNTVVDNLKSYMTAYRSSKARQDAENLEVICEERKADYYRAQQAYAKYIDANKSVVLQSANAERERLQQEMNLAYQVYSQVANNLEGVRIQAEQAKPVFVVVQPAVVPLQKSAPSKAKILIIFIFLAGCCAVGLILFGDKYWKKLKENL